MQKYTEAQKETGDIVRNLAEQSPYGWKAFYKSQQWERKRKSVLQRDHYACQECRRKGRYCRANTVHHIRHLKDEPELALEDDNLESLCRDCHEAIHEKENRQKDFWTPEKW